MTDRPAAARTVSNEPIWWLPFSGGGMLAALFLPVHVVLFGLALPLGWVADPGAEHIRGLVEHPVGRVYLFVFVSGCLLHAAHRLRYLLVELGLHAFGGPIAWACYGGAVVGSLWGAWVVFSP